MTVSDATSSDYDDYNTVFSDVGYCVVTVLRRLTFHISSFIVLRLSTQSSIML